MKTGYIEPFLFITGPIPMVKLVIVCVRPAVPTHISVTASRNFLILGMMMGYDLDILTWSGIPDAQTKMFVSEKGSNVITIHRQQTHLVLVSPMFPITIVKIVASIQRSKGLI